MGIAKEYGHEFTSDKLSQLSEEELESVAGGWTVAITQSARCSCNDCYDCSDFPSASKLTHSKPLH